MSTKDLPKTDDRKVATATLNMAVGTFTSRALGFVRNALQVSAIGVTTMAANAFDTGNNLPSFFYAILAGGALNAILVPQITKALKDKNNGKAFIDRLLSLGMFFMFILTVILMFFSNLLVTLYTNGWPDEKKALAVMFTLWCLPQLFFYGLYTLLGQLLNAKGSFGPYMWSPALNNVVSIIGFSIFIKIFGKSNTDLHGAENIAHLGWSNGKIALLAGTVLAAVASQALILIIPLRKVYKFKFRLQFKNTGLGSSIRVAIWTILMLIVDQIAVLIAYKMASGSQSAAAGAGVSSNASFTNALFIYILPHSLFTVSLVTVLFTRISKYAVEKRYDLVKKDFSHGVRTTSSITIFCTGALIVLSTPFSRFLLPGSTENDVIGVGRAVVPLSLGLVPLGMTLLIKRVFYAFEDGKTVFMLQLPMSALLIFGSILSTRVLKPECWVVGIAASYAASYALGVVLRIRHLRRLLNGIDGKRIIIMHIKSIFAAIISIIVGYLLKNLVFHNVLSIPSSIIQVISIGTIMGIVYFFITYILKSHELLNFIKSFKKH